VNSVIPTKQYSTDEIIIIIRCTSRLLLVKFNVCKWVKLDIWSDRAKL